MLPGELGQDHGSIISSLSTGGGRGNQMPLLQGVSLRQITIVGHSFALGRLRKPQNQLVPSTKSLILFRLLVPTMCVSKALKLKRCLISQQI